MLFANVLLSVLVTSFAAVTAHTIPGHSSLQSQRLSKRGDLGAAEQIYQNLSPEETDFINVHIKNLTDATGYWCDKCVNRLKYAKYLVETYPTQEHLVTLLLYKDCVQEKSVSMCQFAEFFISTDSSNHEAFDDKYNSGVTSTSGVSFYDNDFLNVIKNFNLSSELDMEYYCFYRYGTCGLPQTPDVEQLFNLSSWWPAKDPKYDNPPTYKNNSERFNVAHISDFHIQDYHVGAESNCTESPCGEPYSFSKDLPGSDYNFTTYYKNIDPSIDTFNFSFYPDARYENSTYIKGDYYDFPRYRGYNYVNAPATPFGGYLSDSPELLVNSSLLEVAKLHESKNFELLLFTGDMVNHAGSHIGPNTTKQEEIKGFNLIKNYLGNIPIMPSLGNHDAWPYAQVAPLKYDRQNEYQYNIDEMVDLWINNDWFDEKNATELKQHYTGFSYVTNRGLKIIALNSNTYYVANLWTYINQSTEGDLFGNWKFLIDELSESEAKGQRVWIMAHVPPGNDDVLPIQSRIFGKIVERFSPYTIASLFYGHTHRDEFSILYSSNTTAADGVASEVVNMAWIAQSVSPFTNFNPSFKWYEVEHESFNIINAYNHYTQLNLTFNNGGEEAQWQMEYSARDFYDTNKDWPTDAPLNGTFWHNFVAQRLWNTSDVAFSQKYTDMKYRLSPFTPNCTGGDGKVSDQCFNDNNCFINFYSDNTINCKKS
ncbi:uncharacterized protein LODBEIA_P17270 [Lodderomyces beijingensis]|uniref:Calcineurin-like phosphoesterase domain-containing protein n=1 Tax=Lodderomyces beijingensis TaxID=1775926 RepID=A0ABP0ZIP4_9ASCO